MCHKLPFPFTPRVFANLVISYKHCDKLFMVVQCPVDLRRFEFARYSNSRHYAFGNTKLRRKSVVIGYVAFPL